MWVWHILVSIIMSPQLRGLEAKEPVAISATPRMTLGAWSVRTYRSRWFVETQLAKTCLREDVDVGDLEVAGECEIHNVDELRDNSHKGWIAPQRQCK